MGLGKFIRKMEHNYFALKYLFNLEKKCSSKLSLLKKIWCLFHGFSSEKYILYEMTKNNYRLYLSDFQRHKTSHINGRYSIILDDKNIFTKLLEKENVTAKVFGEILGGKLYLNQKEVSLNELKELIILNSKIIIKKRAGGGGKGIYKLHFESENIHLNDQPVSNEELSKFIDKLDNYIIVEHLNQADYANNIYSGTINTIRIITMKDPETGEIFIPIAVHKFGSEKTKPADNVWRGGMTALVDIETGILKKSALHLEGNRKIIWQEYHPDTKQRIEGTAVPHWNYVKNKVIEIAKKMDFLNYVGWDVVVTDDGVKIIEGNNYSDVNILQIHQPLLIDERVRRFYKHYKIINSTFAPIK